MYQSLLQQRPLEKFLKGGELLCHTCKDEGGKGSQTAFSLKGLLQHASTKPGARHRAYNAALTLPGGRRPQQQGEGPGKDRGVRWE
jgi:hypothetical protein